MGLFHLGSTQYDVLCKGLSKYYEPPFLIFTSEDQCDSAVLLEPSGLTDLTPLVHTVSCVLP